MLIREDVRDGEVQVQPQVLLLRSARLTNWDVPNLSAPFWRCYVPFDGGGYLRHHDRRIEMKPGSIFVIPPSTQCSASSEGSFRKLYIHFTCAETWPGGQIPILPLAANRLRALSQTQSGRDVWWLALATLMEALAEIGGQQRPTMSRLVQDVLNVLTERLTDPPSNAELGRLFGLHANSVVRRFTQEMGLPPQRYALGLRLDAAAQDLASRADSIDVIADRYAFWDRNHFTRAFARRWACPPAEFRQRNYG